MKKILFTLICIMSINMANAQIVNIPDLQFKGVLVNNPAINTNGDGEIQVTEAAAYMGGINAFNMGIFDLTGIEAFTALDNIDCSYNYLTSLNMSANAALNGLWCDNNQLTSLDVSANTALTQLSCQGNQLTSLDVSANTVLSFLHCSENQLTSLNVSTNTALTNIYCDQNQLTSLNVSANTALTYLDCFLNSLTSLNVSANTALTHLDCAPNSLTSLDVSANTALTYLDCWHNQLTSLNVQNGNNSNFTDFIANNNPNLTCIQVDNVAYSNANWSAYKDATASFSTDCGVTSIPDIDKLAAVKIIPNPATNYLTIDLPDEKEKVEVTITDIAGKIIYSTIARETQNIKVNTKEFAEGVYLVKVQSGDFSATKKLVVAK